MNRGFLLKSLGCRVNQVDSRHLAEALALKGIFPAVREERPAVVVVFTCTVTGRADSKSRRVLRQARRDNPGALVVLAGCMAALLAPKSPEEIGGSTPRPENEEPWDMIFDLRRSGFEALAAEISSRLVIEPPSGETLGFFGLDRTRAFIKIQGGCDCFCTYCIVPRVRGPVSSRESDEVVAEVMVLLARGVREIVLTGINIGRYGDDRSEKKALAALADRILDLSGLDRLRFSSIEPMDVDADIMKLACRPRFCPHLHLPVQSGSDRILGLMGRPYSIGLVEEMIAAVRVMLPEMNFTTDIIAGFPGEEEDDFAATLDFVKRAGITKVHAFPFSPREGTPAAAMKPVIPGNTASARVAALIAAGEENFMARGRAMEGRLVEVLVETGGSDCMARGLARDYMRVAVFSSPGAGEWPPRPNTMLNAVVEGVRPGELLARAVKILKPEEE